MKPGKHIIGSVVHQRQNEVLETRLVRTEEMPAFRGSCPLSSSPISMASRWKASERTISLSISRRNSVIGSPGDTGSVPEGWHSISSFSTLHAPVAAARCSTSALSRSRSLRIRHASGVLPTIFNRITK